MIRALGRARRSSPDGLVLEVPGWPGHRPGQFAMLTLDPRGGRLDPLLGRPMAVYRGDGKNLEFRFKVVGRGTRALSEVARGSEVGVVGPLGNGFDPAPAGSVLVGGGTGIASLFGLAAGSPGQVRVLLGGRTRADLLGYPDFEALDLDLEVATEDGSLGHKGLVTELCRAEPGQTLIACGPLGMMRAVAGIANRAGARCVVCLESPMACGFGICLGCAVPTRDGFCYVCTAGPVFDAGFVDWERLR
ncbi:MAG: dihydroorotate dehydrogenase electron transfer subunit [Myxococcota bacterium]